MARMLRYVEKMLARFPAGTLDRIDAVREPLEDRAEFVRAAIERELQRRERRAPAAPSPARRNRAAA